MPIQTGTSLIRDLTDGSPDGTQLGGSNTDPIAFFGGTPITQPFGNAQTAVSRGQAAGVIATYSTTQTPVSAGVGANTSAEYVATVQTGTGATMLVASGDLLFVNKPTSQAGLGVGNVRVSASNTVGITFSNATSASITPSSAEVYGVVGIRGGLVISSTLTPAAVASKSVVEQQFTVTGIQAGTLVQVNKPTSQTGLDIGGVRAVSNNVVGITYTNPTSAAITPNSAESYTFTSLAGLDALNNDVFYGFNTGTSISQGAGLLSATSANTALTGLATTDQITSIYKPTAQAAASAGLPFAVISAANTIALYYLSNAAWTPTSAEVYQIRTAKLAPVAPLVVYTQTLSPLAVSANTTAEQTFTVSGLVASSPVWVNKPSYTSGLAILGCRVSSANTLAINYANLTSASITPPSESYLIGNFQAPLPGTGNSVYQTALPVVNSLGNLANATRSVLTTLGIMAGA